MKRIPLTQQVRAEKLTYTDCSITYVHTKRSTNLSRIINTSRNLRIDILCVDITFPNLKKPDRLAKDNNQCAERILIDSEHLFWKNDKSVHVQIRIRISVHDGPEYAIIA